MKWQVPYHVTDEQALANQAYLEQECDRLEAERDRARDLACRLAEASWITPEQREVVVLRIWSGLTLAEVADVTGTSVSTAFARYRAGLAEIRRIMESSVCKTTTENETPNRRR